MAFSVAGGYGNLPNGKFSPVIYSSKVLKAFRKASVAEAITNTDYSGEIANFGDSVKVILEPDITVTALQRGTQVTAQNLIDQDMTLVVDKANYFAFKVDDIEEKHSHVSWDSLASDRAAYKLKDAFDADVLTVMADGALSTNVVGLGTKTVSVQVATGVTPSSGVFTPLGVMSRAVRFLDLQNVPKENRFFVGDPIFWEQLRDENQKFMDLQVTGDPSSILRNGRVSAGLIRGFNCYESNNLPAGGTGADSTHGGANYGTLICGHMSSTATVSQIAKTESFRDPHSFSDICRGMHLYGRNIIRSEGLVTIRYSVG
jgi:hypothetical protein